MMGEGVRAVAALEVRDRLREGLVRLAFGLLAVLGLALVIRSVPGAATVETVTLRYGVVGATPVGLKAVMKPPTGYKVVYVAESTAATAKHDVVARRVDAALVDGRIVAASSGDTAAVQLLRRAAARSAVVQRLEDAGVEQSEAERAGLLTAPPVTVLSPPSRTRRSATAFVTTLVPIVAVLVFILTNLAAGGIQEERGTRMADMLLVPLRPGEIVTGKVAAAAALAAIMAAVAAVPNAALAVAIHGLHIVGQVPLTLAATLLFVALQFALYGYAAAAGGATVAGALETQLVTLPIGITMAAGALLTRTVVAAHPDSVGSTLISMFPPFTPMAMLMRTAAGHVPAWQVVTSIALTVAATVWVARAATSVYLGAVVGSNTNRIKLRRAYLTGRAAQRRAV